ncbi:MAG TPA: ABC transporter permease [Candidatus Limnocylindria bacterium]|nr:ABC transporter permease [Candidatus Limnocylindria bacterium]
MTQRILGGAGRFLRKYGLSILTVALLLVVWQVAVDYFRIKKYILPSPALILNSFIDPRQAARNQWLKHFTATTTGILGAFGLTVAAGFLIAVVIVWSKTANRIIMPLIVLFNSIPKIALAPLFLLWLGYGTFPHIMIAFAVAFFPIVINSAVGMQAVDDDLLDLVRYLGASKLQVFLKIRIPNSLPYIFAGVKTSTTMCIVGVLVGEFIASKRGLGYLIRDAQAFIDMPTMFAALVVLAAIGMAFFGLISVLERVLMPWEPSLRGEAAE